ncbi:MAG: hypothetical protein EP338_03005 [Bacteroidetes bacterium]|nr:MAG: hypothetical protein EP338_03005 [Bacteroidota bacterium]
MKKILQIVLFFPLMLQAQEDTIEWKKLYQIPFPAHDYWCPDYLGQLYSVQGDLIRKYDQQGKLLFEQSFKRFGSLNEIDVRNPMKILLFSEQQQMLFYVDNALARQELEIDLSEMGLNYATHVSASVQPDKIWVYDQDNSRIRLIATQSQQAIQIDNTSGILDLGEVQRMEEEDGFLYVVNSKSWLYQFDLFGTFVSKVHLGAYDDLSILEGKVYLLKAGALRVISLKDLSEKKVELPLKKVKSMSVQHKRIFLLAGGEIFLYELEIF